MIKVKLRKILFLKWSLQLQRLLVKNLKKSIIRNTISKPFLLKLMSQNQEKLLPPLSSPMLEKLLLLKNQ